MCSFSSVDSPKLFIVGTGDKAELHEGLEGKKIDEDQRGMTKVVRTGKFIGANIEISNLLNTTSSHLRYLDTSEEHTVFCIFFEYN